MNFVVIGVTLQVKNEKAQHYLEQHLYSVKDDVFALSTVTYALHLADSPKKEISLKMLENHKISDKGKSICYLNVSKRIVMMFLIAFMFVLVTLAFTLIHVRLIYKM